MADQESVSPDDLPYDTAPDYAERWGENLNVSNDVVKQAMEYSKRYDLKEPLPHQPRTIAAGALYLVALLKNEKVTQPKLEEVTGVNRHSLSVAYRRMAIKEGYEISTPAVDDESDQNLNHQNIGSIVGKILDKLLSNNA